MREIIIFLCLFVSMGSFSQNSLKGDVFDEKNTSLPYCTVVLLKPADSTMAYYAVTNMAGHFEISTIKAADYLLQITYIGFETYFKPIYIPFENGNIGNITMKPSTVNLKEVEIKGEHSPMVFKKDTVEYNAAAFKVNPDASTEELLRKLPGVEVDRAGNIKALGENVSKVLVDGKEFFSNDPKVATKNLPAEAVKKVQVYDNKSEESQFTGMSERNQGKEMNLILKDDHKNGLFGEVSAGLGTDKRYQGNAKMFNFSPKMQYAGIGMLNNINQYGFSFQDYINYNGGLQGLSGGSGSTSIRISNDGDFPVNFGQTVNGKVTSGVGGANFSYQASKYNRLNFSYLMTGTDKKQTDSIFTRNYTSNNDFTQQTNQTSRNSGLTHRINFSWRNRVDSTGQFFANGGISFGASKWANDGLTASFVGVDPINSLLAKGSSNSNRFSGNANTSYVIKKNKSKTIIKFVAAASGSADVNKSLHDDRTSYFAPVNVLLDHQYRSEYLASRSFSVGTSVTQKIGKLWYLEPNFSYANNFDGLNRKVSLSNDETQVTAYQSPDFKNIAKIITTGIQLKYHKGGDIFEIYANIETAQVNNTLNSQSKIHSNYTYFLPGFRWELEYRTGRRLNINYMTMVNRPSVSQLLPITDEGNRLMVTTGNPFQKPEYSHNLFAHWLVYDQFSFTSLFVNTNIGYTKDKINWSRTIKQDLGQELNLVNTDNEIHGSTGVSFSTPISKLGLKINTNLTQNWNIGTSFVNTVENRNSNLIHKFLLSFENRNKEKWGAAIGASVQYTVARYDIQKSLNDKYFDKTYFADLKYTPNKSWDFGASADITDYNASSFEKAITVPLIGCSVNYFFLKNKRGTLSLSGVDLLNKNTGIQRISEMNYLREIRSDVIGRYFMLSFKYRLNKINNNSGLIVQ